MRQSCASSLTNRHLEGLLLASEVAEAATVGAATTTAATSTASTTVAEATASTATSTTASAAVTEATTSTTATAASTTTAATTGITVWAGGSVIETDWASTDISTHHVLHGVLGILNRREGDVSEALGVSGVPDKMLVGSTFFCVDGITYISVGSLTFTTVP